MALSGHLKSVLADTANDPKRKCRSVARPERERNQLRSAADSCFHLAKITRCVHA